MDEYARLASEGMENEGLGSGRSEHVQGMTRSRLFSVAPHLAADLDEAAIAKMVRCPAWLREPTPTYLCSLTFLQVRVPSVRHFVRSMFSETYAMLRSHFLLLLIVFVVSIGLVGGIIGGLTTLQQQGICSIIAAGHVERTVTIAPIQGLDVFANVVIDHRWPRGSVEIVAGEYRPTGAREVRT